MTTLREALGVGATDVVALVGAGGKTTALFLLAHELRMAGANPVVTTTTKILIPGSEARLRVLVDGDREALGRAVAGVGAAIPVAATATTPDGKLVGLPPEWIADLAALPRVTHVLVEADGAARLPVKAPREDEPVIPAATTIVVAVVGIDALGGTLSRVAHRPERVAALTGLGPDDPLDARAMARVMCGDDGMTRGRPATARVVMLVNKADDEGRVRDARLVARELAAIGARRVVIAALEHGGVIEVQGG